MHRHWSICIVVGAITLGVLAACATSELQSRVDADGFSTLFNGKDLTGWKAHEKLRGKWMVNNGELVSKGVQGYLFTTREDWRNFHLKLEALIESGGNSGVFFRCAYDLEPRGVVNGEKVHRPVGGYEAELFWAPPTVWPGRIKGLAEAKEELAPPGRWLTLEVIAQGAGLTTRINGKTAVAVEDRQNLHRSGYIALQSFTSGTSVRFRSIRIKELGTQPVAPSGRTGKPGTPPPAPGKGNPTGPDFRVTVRLPGQPNDEIDRVSEALAHLDKLIAGSGQAKGFEATVKVLANEKLFKSPKDARKGVETMLLSATEAVSQQYGVTIIATEVKAMLHGALCQTRPPAKDDVLVFGLEAIRFLQGFTPQAIRRTGLKRIVLCEQVAFNGQPGPQGGGAFYDTLVLEIKGFHEIKGPQLDMISASFYHELYHVFDATTLGLRMWTDPEWMAANPPGFTYKGYKDFFGADGKMKKEGFAQEAPEGFLGVYSTASIVEDKANVYVVMMVAPDWLEEQIKKDRHLRAKVELIDSRLRLLGPEFQPGFWRKSQAAKPGAPQSPTKK